MFLGTVTASDWTSNFTTLGTQITTDAAIVITAGLLLLGVKYGVVWVKGLFKSVAR